MKISAATAGAAIITLGLLYAGARLSSTTFHEAATPTETTMGTPLQRRLARDARVRIIVQEIQEGMEHSRAHPIEKTKAPPYFSLG